MEKRKVHIYDQWSIGDMESALPSIELLKRDIEKVVMANTYEALKHFIDSIIIFATVTDKDDGLQLCVYSDLEYSDVIDGENLCQNIVGKELPLETLIDDLYIPKSEEQRKEVEKAVKALENLADKAREKYLNESA